MIESVNCKDCIHNDVCKWCGHLDKRSEEFSNKFIEFGNSEIFDVIFKCRKFDKKKVATFRGNQID